MPDLRTPEIRLADALDRIAELEGCVMKNAESFQRVLDVAMRAEARIAELEAENKRLAELLADRESEDQGLAGLVVYQPISAAAQEALQTAPSVQPLSDAASPHTGLWRALRAGKG